jgi:hypothetical protein
MKNYFPILFFFFPFIFFSQAKVANDSAYIYFQNSGKKKISIINSVIHGNELYVGNLKPGKKLGPFAISLKKNDVFRFSCYLKKDHQDKNSIEPMDYPSQVSEEKMTSGIYIYYINSDDDVGGSLNVKIEKLRELFPKK